MVWVNYISLIENLFKIDFEHKSIVLVVKIINSNNFWIIWQKLWYLIFSKFDTHVDGADEVSNIEIIWTFLSSWIWYRVQYHLHNQEMGATIQCGRHCTKSSTPYTSYKFFRKESPHLGLGMYINFPDVENTVSRRLHDILIARYMLPIVHVRILCFYMLLVSTVIFD
jgi:hypothetical protein